MSGSSVALNLLKVRSRCTSHRGEVAAGRRQLRQRNSTPTSEGADGQKSPQHRIRRQPRRQESHPTSYHIQEGLLFESPAPTVVGIAGCQRRERLPFHSSTASIQSSSCNTSRIAAESRLLEPPLSTFKFCFPSGTIMNAPKLRKNIYIASRYVPSLSHHHPLSSLLSS